MAANKTFRFGPIALTATLTTNLLNPPAASGGVNAGASGQYIVLRKLRVLNKTTGAQSFSMWLGASAGNVAGTEVIGQGKIVAANDAYDWVGMLRIDVADFLVGGASAATSLTVEGEGEIGVAG